MCSMRCKCFQVLANQVDFSSLQVANEDLTLEHVAEEEQVDTTASKKKKKKQKTLENDL